MKHTPILAFLYLLVWDTISVAQNADQRQLWLITARITHQNTYNSDTASSFMAGSMKWEKESHQSARVTSNGTITAVVENQAENPATGFLYHSDSGDPVSLLVTGSGSSAQSDNSQETIDGVLISADIRTDNVSGTARPGASIYFEYSDVSRSFGVTMGIKAVGSYSGRMYSGGRGYGEWKDYGGNYDDYNLNLGGGGDALTEKNCRMTKTGKGYQGSWKESENKRRSTSGRPENIISETTVEITVTPYKESDKPLVAIYGCSELSVEEKSNVMASGKPEGGKFRFWVEPGNLFTVEPDAESSANLTGKEAGKGTMYVEYTSPDGKTNQTSQPASCVKIENYNGGQKIPQIALYDVDGKKLPGVLKVPVTAQPSNIEELVDFVSADPSIASSTGRSGAVDLTGSREGRTTLQAKTNCGEQTGPAVEIEVVNCDDETIATLERMMQAAKEGQKQAYEAIEKIVGTKEFEEMESKISESTGNLAIKTAGLIIGTLAGGRTAGAGVETAAGIYGKASNVMDILKGGDALSQISNVSQLIVELGGKAMQQAIAGSIETLQAANEFGQDLGKMIGASREFQSAMKEAEHWNKIIIDLVNRQKLCRRGSQEPKPEPGKQTPEPKPTPDEPTAKTQTPPTEKPTKSEPAQPAEPPTTDQPSDDGTEISPPPPTSPPRQVGLPYSPSECGCNQTSTLEVSQKSFASLQTGMENLGKCVETFSKGPLPNYIQTLQDWQKVLNTLQEATKAKPAEFKLATEQALPKMETLLKQTKTFDTEGKKFMDDFGSCPKSMEEGIGLMKSAMIITVDSIKTNY